MHPNQLLSYKFNGENPVITGLKYKFLILKGNTPYLVALLLCKCSHSYSLYSNLKKKYYGLRNASNIR